MDKLAKQVVLLELKEFEIDFLYSLTRNNINLENCLEDIGELLISLYSKSLYADKFEALNGNIRQGKKIDDSLLAIKTLLQEAIKNHADLLKNEKNRNNIQTEASKTERTVLQKDASLLKTLDSLLAQVEEKGLPVYDNRMVNLLNHFNYATIDNYSLSFLEKILDKLRREKNE